MRSSVSLCMCVSESVTSLCHCGLKAFQLESKHCSIIRGKLKSRNRDTHTQSDREDSMRQRHSALTERREERLRLRHWAQTGIKELEREGEGKDQRSRAISLFFFFIHVRQRRSASHQMSVCAPTLPVNCVVTMATGVFRAKDYVIPKEQTVWVDFITHLLSYAQTRLCTFCPGSDKQENRKTSYVRSVYVMCKGVRTQTFIFIFIKTSDAH